METLNIVNQLLTDYNIEYSYKMIQNEEFYDVSYGIKDYNEESFNLFKDEFKEIAGYDGWEITLGGDENHIEDLFISVGDFYWRFSFFKSL